MKTRERIVGNVLACLLGASSGCSQKSPTYALECARETTVGFADMDCACVRVIEIDGHRFAVVQGKYNRAVGICEVTDASLIKTNAEVSR